MQNIEENRVVSREAKHYECVALPTELLRQSRENQRESLFSSPGTHYTKWRFLGGIKRVWSDLAYKIRHRAKRPKKDDDWVDLSGAFNDGYTYNFWTSWWTDFQELLEQLNKGYGE